MTEIIAILGIIAGLPAVYIGIQSYLKQKPVFQFRGTKYRDDNSVIYWRFKISNSTNTSFILKKVSVKKHFFLFIYKNKVELNWHADYEFHTTKNIFDNSDSIKPNEDINIVVKPPVDTDNFKNYSSVINISKKYKFIFKTSLKNYVTIVNRASLLDELAYSVPLKVREKF